MSIQYPHENYNANDFRYRRNYDVGRDTYQAINIMHLIESLTYLQDIATSQMSAEQKAKFNDVFTRIEQYKTWCSDVNADIAIEHVLYDAWVADSGRTINTFTSAEHAAIQTSAKNFTDLLNKKTQAELVVPKYQYTTRFINEILHDHHRETAQRFLKAGAKIVITLSTGDNADDKEVTAEAIFTKLKALFFPVEGPAIASPIPPSSIPAPAPAPTPTPTPTEEGE